MKKELQKFALFILALTALSSCKKPEDDSDLIVASECKNTTLWLKNNHKLSYKNYPTFFSIGDSIFVEYKEVSPGIFKSLQSIDKSPQITSLYFQPCGNIVHQSSLSSMANKYEVYRLDGAIGENWSYTQQSALGYTITITTTISEKNVNVTVPAGTFKCMKYMVVMNYKDSPPGGLKTEIWLTPKYGLIKLKGLSAHYELAKANF